MLCRVAAPRAGNVTSHQHHYHHPHSLLPQDVPPDPSVLALEQPVSAALGYALRETFLHVALPLLALWLLQRWLGHLEKRTREADVSGASPGGRGGVAALPLFRQLAGLLPVAATAPSRTALTLLTVTHVARSAANILQGLGERVLLARGTPAADDLQRILEHGRTVQLLQSAKAALVKLDQGLILFYQVALVVFGCWALLSWKDVALGRFLMSHQTTTQGRQELERILTPLNSFATWALVLAAGMLVVQMLGVDVKPLLLVTGWSSVLAGLASQQLLANAVSGMQIYLDRPFQVGDTISVMSGVTVYTGEVVEVAALRTHLALEDGSAVAIPNRALADMVITNKSKSSKRLNRPPWYHSHAPLALQLRIRVRPPDYGHSLPAELEELRRQVLASGAVETEGPVAPRLEVTAFTEKGVEVLLRCRLRNPAKLASSAASGNLAQQADAAALQLAAAASGAGGGSTADRAAPFVHATGNGNGRSEGGAQSSAASRASFEQPGGDGGGGERDSASVRSFTRGQAVIRNDAVRQLRQQLVLALGPWLQSRNATLVVVD